MTALPSKTSNLRFADQAHGIARLHISEALSLGFDPVANETAQTVLDLALQKLNDCALLLDPADADQQIKKILQN